MLGNILGNIAKIFGGSAQERSMKEVAPIVDKINAVYTTLEGLSHDELRGKTHEFKSRIADFLKEIDDQIHESQDKVEALTNEEVEAKEALFAEISQLEKQRDEKLEVVLLELLPEAFAVIKETARRFTQNEEIQVNASDLDRELALNHTNIRIENNQAIYKNE